MDKDKSRVALVTGSGQGIGRGIAIKLAQDGFTVILNSRRADPANTEWGPYEVKAVIETDGGKADVVKADVSDAADRERIAEFISSRYGRLDLLVNNAGVAPKERKDILDASQESFDRVLGINLRGPYFLTQLIARKMIEWKNNGTVEQPRIAFITSISAYTSSPSRGEYCVSKAGLSMAAKLYAHRLAEYGIPVIEIQPGIIETPMTSGVKEKYDALIADGLLLTKRWGRPEDVAALVSAFARGDLDYSTGESIEVGGGFGLLRL
ncbi:MAG: 3-ketoacyl-ACP reductase [Candidatus Hydrogenedentes bacterium]|nr:3-ketoacyl-ACP reductase [Candidatus Hydrogenedentota bacterium]